MIIQQAYVAADAVAAEVVKVVVVVVVVVVVCARPNLFLGALT